MKDIFTCNRFKSHFVSNARKIGMIKNWSCRRLLIMHRSAAIVCNGLFSGIIKLRNHIIIRIWTVISLFSIKSAISSYQSETFRFLC